MTAEQPYLESKRLVLLRPVGEDLTFLMQILGNRSLTDHPGELPENEKIESVSRQIIDHWSKYPFGPCIFKLRSSGEPIGVGGLKHTILEGKSAIDLGMMFLREHQVAGFGMEAGRALLHHGFGIHGFERIVANTTTHNRGAMRLLDKFGFRPLRILDSNSARANSEYWELTKEMYLQRKQAE